MDINKLVLFLNTIIYLKPIQVFYRLFYFFRNRILNKEAAIRPVPNKNTIEWSNHLSTFSTYDHEENCFTFLNIGHKFLNQIDWNFSEYGKLWTYNLNYFDFLNQKYISKGVGLSLINDYIKNDKILRDGKEPYPISLRGINWIKFLSMNDIHDSKIDRVLYQHYHTLLKNLEFHLLANHLLENAFSLLFAAYYFQDDKIYKKSKELLISELNEQVLSDGGHYELSPMYHQILFNRLLDCINLMKLNDFWKNDELLSFLENKAGLMLSWLLQVTYNNGEIPKVSDSTFGIAPSTMELYNYAKALNIHNQNTVLLDSGYRKINSGCYELFIDVGDIKPSYQPGHAHSDTFNFELVKEGKPVIVDSGISTYEKNNLRNRQRSTYSHNTVKIGTKDQTQVWGGFRVARRAKVEDLIERSDYIRASHDGYKRDGFIHTRSFSWGENSIIIEDNLNKSTKNKANACFHFDYMQEKPEIKGNNVILNSSAIFMEFENASEIVVEEFELSVGFNKTVLAYKIVVTFDHILKTTISL